MNKIIGIDLGTTNSCVSVMKDGKPHVIENSEGGRTTPSIVALTEDGQTLVGMPAKRQAVTNPKNTVFAVKRLIGRRYEEIEEEEHKQSPYSIVKADKSDDAWVEINGEKISPQQVSAKVLTKMREAAQDYLGEMVKEAVITVPAYFNDAQRQATIDAGRIAGLEVKRIINEPTAAALAFGMDDGSQQKIAVFDLGGGTFDISIINILNVDGEREFEVLSTNGNNLLGGEDFDRAIIEYLTDHFKDETGIDLQKDVTALQRLKQEAEQAKIELSSAEQTEINLPYITADSSGPKHLKQMLTRASLENLVKELINQCEKPCRDALKDAKLDGDKVDAVLLVGGMTRMPAVREKAKAIFGMDPRRGINPDEAVAMGAAVQASILDGGINDLVLYDVISHSLGVETEGDVMSPIIKRNSTKPAVISDNYTTVSNNQTSVEVKVLEGEDEKASKNKLLGEFRLEGIRRAPRGVPQIEVTFDIDVNGVLKVSARDKDTGEENSIIINNKSGLSEVEIDAMIADAKASE